MSPDTNTGPPSPDQQPQTGGVSTEQTAAPTGEMHTAPGATHEAQPALYGLARRAINWRLNRADERATQLEDDAQFHQQAGGAALTLKEPKTPYHPLEAFDKVHLTKRPDRYIDAEKPTLEDASGRPTTSLQEMAEQRHSTRVDAINRREGVVEKFISLYGDILHDKEAVEDQLAAGHYTRGQKKAIRSASRQVRKAESSIDRIHDRLDMTADGEDSAGRIISTRAAEYRDDADQWQRRAEWLDRRAGKKQQDKQDAQQRRQQNKQAKQHRKQQGRDERARLKQEKQDNLPASWGM